MMNNEVFGMCAESKMRKVLKRILENAYQVSQVRQRKTTRLGVNWEFKG